MSKETKEQIRGIDFSNCYYANLWEFVDMNNRTTANEKDDWVLVHAVREMAFEWWGDHAFLLNKVSNQILDFSNGKRLEGTKDELFKKWNIQVDGRFMYYEYSFKQALENVDKYRTYGPWELLFEDWQDSRWGKYMSKYFIPTFQPRLNKQREELENK